MNIQLIESLIQIIDALTPEERALLQEKLQNRPIQISPGVYERGLNAEEISDRIGNVTLAEVYAALTYYHANTTEIETDLATQAAEAKRLETLHSSIPHTNHE